MNLIQEINSLDGEDTITQLDNMLEKKCTTSISWSGKRLVSIEGYEGSIEIRILAEKYFNAGPFNRDKKVSLKDRLVCVDLWEKFKTLHNDSEEKLNETSLIKHYVRGSEFAQWWFTGTPTAQATHFGWSEDVTSFRWLKGEIFMFSETEFIEIWGDRKKAVGGCPSLRLLTASREMVEDALNLKRA